MTQPVGWLGLRRNASFCSRLFRIRERIIESSSSRPVRVELESNEPRLSLLSVADDGRDVSDSRLLWKLNSKLVLHYIRAFK